MSVLVALETIKATTTTANMGEVNNKKRGEEMEKQGLKYIC